MLARRMGKPRVIAETGAGQHGVATATICARYGLECVVYMGSEDVKRQAPNVYRMNLLGATVVPVESGSKTLKDALNEALRDWVTNVENTFYIIGTVAGPHPVSDDGARLPARHRRRVPARRCREMIGRQPDAVIACVGGGSNAMGIFYPYIREPRHAPDRRRGGGRGPRQRPARGVDLRRQPGRAARQPHLPAAGRRRPDHRDAFDLGRPRLPRRRPRARLPEGHRPRRVRRRSPTTRRSPRSIASAAPKASSRRSSRAMRSPTRCKLAPTMRPDQHLLVNLSGRGDKDIATVAELDAQRARAGAGMSRIDATFAALRDRGRKALIPYVTAGDPYADGTVEIMLAMAGAGADVIELGVPFCDPMADGPVIQKASERALARGIGMTQVLATVARVPPPGRDDAGRADGLRQSDRALRHRALRRRRRTRRRRRRRAGRRLPARGVRGLRRAAARRAASIRSSCSRRPRPTRASPASPGVASGYVYYVSLKGVTGAGHLDIGAVARDDPAHPGAREAAGRRRLRHPRREDARGRWPRSPMRSSSAAPSSSCLEGAGAGRSGDNGGGDSSPRSAPRSTPEVTEGTTSDELARKTAAAEDPADRPERAPHGARGPVDQVPVVRDGALQDRPREEPVNVCPKCSHHHRIGARARLDAFLDPRAATRSARRCCRSTRSSSRTARSTPSG